MIFEELVLENFRQFPGKQQLIFATSNTQKVTVIHGFNGAGKTTLLNAFIWALYGSATPDFENPEHLENEGEYAKLGLGDRMQVSVNITFREGTTKFVVNRTHSVEKTEEGPRRGSPTVSLKYIDELGEVQDSRHPQDHVEMLLPRRLYPFFFFNGERIDRLAGPDAYDEIENAVKVLLDLELFDRSIDHLESGAARRLREEITKHSGEEGARAREERDALEEKIRQETEKRTQQERNQNSLLAEKEKVDAKLAGMPELASMLADRKAQEDSLERIKSSLSDKRRQLARTFSQDGYLILTPEILRDADAVLAAAHEKGEIPTPLKRQFVDELLEKAICICDRDLKKGEASHQAVLQWRDKAASEELEAAVTITKANLGKLATRRDRAIAELAQVQAQKDELLRERRECEEKLSELHVRIGDRDQGEDPAKLEARRADIENSLDKIKLELHEVRKSLEALDAAMQDKDREIRTLERADEMGRLAQRRLEGVNNVRAALAKIRELRFEEIRTDLSKRLQEVWSKISIKDYRAELDEKFHLRLTKEVAGIRQPVRGASTGEKQVVSLAFIGSLLDKARSTAEAARDEEFGRMFKGGNYGLVIDSAFGQLEPEYRRDVAKWVTTLAPQVIVLVSESQWRREVEEELQPMIGRQYVLCCATPRDKPKDITLQGRKYAYVVESPDGLEASSLTEVRP